ncbi:adenylyltransferase/cytidyltransferase family protein [Morganella morganii]|uniref:adenylyltransferase/cytidyltransferase family protein n=1 Tax=Morganella morganii TaxID=582 RepID=UPI000EE3FA20|nr:adenylyltransferase/cytidyltransferase family protein [Morganella morganii]QXO76690.1 adenylyltransferase/cytidyltransferase family protein [Morganella morganii]HAE79404.1 glycerol-3-phosphate cytidylyltransferase [Morganella sp. (in: enterobacteria)]
MKTIITYGTFDLFHVGHVRILKRLKQLGTRLIVGISTDEFNSIKGKKSFFSYLERAEIVKSCKYVDDIFPENNWTQKRSDIIKYKADILGMGNDWLGKFDDLNDICNVIYLDRTDDISSTDIKNKLSKVTSRDISNIEQQITLMLDVIKTLKVK